MASGNRVDELESRVRELEATISGLTDELVETRERLHALEDEIGPEMDILEGKPTRSEAQTDAQVDGGAEEPTDDSAEDEAAAEEAKAEGDEAEDDADSGSGDDIIVA